MGIHGSAGLVHKTSRNASSCSSLLLPRTSYPVHHNSQDRSSSLFLIITLSLLVPSVSENGSYCFKAMTMSLRNSVYLPVGILFSGQEHAVRNNPGTSLPAASCKPQRSEAREPRSEKLRLRCTSTAVLNTPSSMRDGLFRGYQGRPKIPRDGGTLLEYYCTYSA